LKIGINCDAVVTVTLFGLQNVCSIIFPFQSRKSLSFLGKKIFLTSLGNFPLAGSLCKSEKDDDKSKIHRSVLSQPKFSFVYIPTLLNCQQPFETVSITNKGNDPTTLQVPLCQKQISSIFLPVIA
jgi:hypothetical protein